MLLFQPGETELARTISMRPAAVHAQGAFVPEHIECDRSLSWNVGRVHALFLAYRPDSQNVGAIRAPLCLVRSLPRV